MIANIDGFSEKLQRTSARPICPECGNPMKAADFSRENGVQYTWYVCGRSGCDGQWLEKDSVISPLEKWRKYRAAAGRYSRL